MIVFVWTEIKICVSYRLRLQSSSCGRSLIDPLQFTITWYKNRHTGEQTAHWGIYCYLRAINNNNNNNNNKAKAKCSGTTDNLMIDRMVTLDCHRNKRNLSVAWIDVRKAYDCVDHDHVAPQISEMDL